MSTFSHSRAKIEAGGRVFLPTELVGRLAWLLGDEPIQCFLLVIEPGRYRLLSRNEVEGAPALRDLVPAEVESEDDTPDADPYEAEPAESVLLSLRLIPATVSPRGPGWRLTLPKSLRALQAMDAGTDVVLIRYKGYVEIWSKECFDRALRVPLVRLLH